MNSAFFKKIIITALLVGGCLVYLLTFSYVNIGIPCLFFLVTGLRCPGCGITHMLTFLLQGNIAEAYASNAYLFITSPAYIYLCVKIYFCWLFGRQVRWKLLENILIYCLLVSALVFGVVRNL